MTQGKDSEKERQREAGNPLGKGSLCQHSHATDRIQIHVTQTNSQKVCHTVDAAVTEASHFLVSCRSGTHLTN